MDLQVRPRKSKPAPSKSTTYTENSNSQPSTGLPTEAGKRRSSLNACRHGLTVQTIADSNWRLNRARTYESAFFFRVFADYTRIRDPR